MSSAPSSLVHPQETKSDVREWDTLEGFKFNWNIEFSPQPADPFETSFRHSGWAARRGKIFTALCHCGTSQHTLENFHSCGSGLWVMKGKKTGAYSLSCNCCHSRWCIPCMTAEARIIQENILPLIDKTNPRFLTLTLRHSATPLKDQLDRLYASFLKLRNRKEWKAHVTGGAAFCEIKLSDRDGLFHVHLHVLIVGKFWDQREIAEQWHAITGDSYIVHIEQISSAGKAAQYLTKYVTKVADDTVLRDKDKLYEMIVSLKGRRLCTTFGTWRKIKLREAPEPTEEKVAVQALSVLISQARTGDVESQTILQALNLRKESS